MKLPPGAFLQASREAEAELVGARAGMGRRAPSAWPICLPASAPSPSPWRANAAVDAYEADEAALAALAEAARKTPKLKPVKTIARDLFRSPLGAEGAQSL